MEILDWKTKEMHKVIHSFLVMRPDWEMDNEAWVSDDLRIWTTSHGGGNDGRLIVDGRVHLDLCFYDYRYFEEDYRNIKKSMHGFEKAIAIILEQTSKEHETLMKLKWG